jgi:serine/threonine protein phosphatase PrpC
MLTIAEHVELSDTGMQRRTNEDSVLSIPPVFVVADGMGGAQAGEVASGIAIEAFAGGLPESGSSEARLAAVAEAANARIHELSSSDRARAGMGSTLVAAYVDGDGVALAHVGDSRAYRWRDGELERLTRDHSLVGMWIERGDITEKEAEEHPQRSVITRALGPEPTVDVETQTAPARSGDIFLLCSDGLNSMVGDPELSSLFAAGGTLEQLAHRLVDEANRRGGRDNITVVLFRVEEGEESEQSPIDATRVGESALSASELRAALARQQAAATAASPTDAPAEEALPAARKIAPRPPPSDRKRPRRSRRRARGLAFATFLALVLTAVLVGGYIAIQDVYFVSTTPDGFVAVDRGLPYDLPFGISLYSTVFRSGVAADELQPTRRKTLLDHRLRTQDDAYGLVRAVDAGQVTP